MRVVRFDLDDPGVGSEPSVPARLVEAPDPPLPGPGWARVGVTGGGICGSDLDVFFPRHGPSPALLGYATLPFDLGHEVAGRVLEAGDDCPVAPGTRVAVDPLLACAVRGIDPPCDRCASGAASACRNLGSRVLTPGLSLGYTSGLGGGWGDMVLAHHSQLHVLPGGVPERLGTLAEPLSIAVHGLLRVPPPPGPVLVVGAGAVGLLALAALRNLFPDAEVTVVAKHPHQQEVAAAMGAHHVVGLGDDLLTRLAPPAGTEVKGRGEAAILAGGYPHVVEAVGTDEAVTLALRCVDGRGTVLLLGAAGVSTVDLTPVWFKEAALVGSFCHAHDPVPGGRGTVHSMARAVELLASGAVPDALVSHELPLVDWRAGLDVARGMGERPALKVVLRPDGA